MAAQSFNGLDMKNLYKGYLQAKPQHQIKPVLQNSLVGNQIQPARRG